jgi:hypothetical protein
VSPRSHPVPQHLGAERLALSFGQRRLCARGLRRHKHGAVIAMLHSEQLQALKLVDYRARVMAQRHGRHRVEYLRRRLRFGICRGVLADVIEHREQGLQLARPGSALSRGCLLSTIKNGREAQLCRFKAVVWNNVTSKRRCSDTAAARSI